MVREKPQLCLLWKWRGGFRMTFDLSGTGRGSDPWWSQTGVGWMCASGKTETARERVCSYNKQYPVLVGLRPGIQGTFTKTTSQRENTWTSAIDHIVSVSSVFNHIALTLSSAVIWTQIWSFGCSKALSWKILAQSLHWFLRRWIKYCRMQLHEEHSSAVFKCDRSVVTSQRTRRVIG